MTQHTEDDAKARQQSVIAGFDRLLGDLDVAQKEHKNVKPQAVERGQAALRDFVAQLSPEERTLCEQRLERYQEAFGIVRRVTSMRKGFHNRMAATAGSLLGGVAEAVTAVKEPLRTLAKETVELAVTTLGFAFYGLYKGVLTTGRLFRGPAAAAA